MEIDDTRINKLKRDAETAREADFQAGYEAGVEWCRHAEYTAIRSIVFKDRQAENSSYREDFNEATDLAVELSRDIGCEGLDDFFEIIGYDGQQELGKLIEGWLHAVREYANEAKRHGVPF